MSVKAFIGIILLVVLLMALAIWSAGCASGTDALRQTITNTATATAAGYRTIHIIDKKAQELIQAKAKLGDVAGAKASLETHLKRYDVASKVLDVAVTTTEAANAALPALEKGLRGDKDVSGWISTLLKLAADITSAVHGLEEAH